MSPTVEEIREAWDKFWLWEAAQRSCSLPWLSCSVHVVRGSVTGGGEA